MSTRVALAVVLILTAVLGFIVVIFADFLFPAAISSPGEPTFDALWDELGTLFISGFILMATYVTQIIAAVGVLRAKTWAWTMGVASVSVRLLTIAAALLYMGLSADSLFFFLIRYSLFVLLDLGILGTLFSPFVRQEFSVRPLK